MQISAQAIREITARGIPVCHFSYGGWFHGITVGMAHKNVELRLAQFATAADRRASLPLARSFVVGKIKNSRTLLRRHFNEDADRILPRLAELAQKAASTANCESLLGIEGMAAKLYFSGFTTLFKTDSVFDLDGRNRRPPRDPVNAMLSFVYAVLAKELTVTAYACGFDPLLGFFHRPRYGRPSLALDLAEECRPLIGNHAGCRLTSSTLGRTSPCAAMGPMVLAVENIDQAKVSLVPIWLRPADGLRQEAAALFGVACGVVRPLPDCDPRVDRS